jgi:Protein of unknown function (DUF4242)
VPRYLVQRKLAERLAQPARAEGASARGGIESDELEGVTWVHSYVDEEQTKIVSVYDAPSQSAVREAVADDLPVDAITEIRVLDPEGAAASPVEGQGGTR